MIEVLEEIEMRVVDRIEGHLAREAGPLDDASAEPRWEAEAILEIVRDLKAAKAAEAVLPQPADAHTETGKAEM